MTLVFLYSRENRYSFNALAGSLESDPFCDRVDLLFPATEEQVTSCVDDSLRACKRTLVGISLATQQLWDTQKIVSSLRSKFGAQVILIAGGPHPTADPEGTLRLGFDVCVQGEGEETLRDLLKAIAEGRELGSVKGIAILEAGKCQRTGSRDPINLDAYPPFGVKHGRFGPIEITRGCPYVCAYCQTAHIFGAVPRHRSIETILKYVRTMRDRNLKDVRVITPNAFSYGSLDGRHINLPALERLLREIRNVIGSEGRIFFGSFPSEVRPEHVTDQTVTLVTEYANNDNLILGAQSGSQRVLDLCNRGHTVSDVFNAVSTILEHGLKPNVDFIFGLPGETDEDAESTVAAMTELAMMGARIHAHTFMPLPQTKFARERPLGISKRTLAVLRKLVSKGVVYGDWLEQEKEARRIARYTHTGRL